MSNPSNETFDLITLEDLLQLDESQLERWFNDFKKAHEFTRNLKELGKAIGVDGEIAKFDGPFKWKDDGLSHSKVTIQPVEEVS